MNLAYLLVQILIALFCAGVATFLLPRQVPGRLFGLALIGFAGVWLGEWLLNLLSSTYSLPMPGFVEWKIQDVPVIPAIIGSAIILYAVTTVLSWGRYQR